MNKFSSAKGVGGGGFEPAAPEHASKLSELRARIGRIMIEGTPRKAMTPARKRRIHAQHKGLCTYCGQETEVSGPTVIYDHEIPLELGGADDDSNIGPIHASPCNKIKTAADARQIAKMRRQAKMDEPRAPSQIQSRPFPRDLRKKMNGSVVRRAT
jgi:5-methylcytosine-specific restriction endonuclease McrA